MPAVAPHDDRRDPRQRNGRSGPAGAVGDAQARFVDRDRGRVALLATAGRSMRWSTAMRRALRSTRNPTASRPLSISRLAAKSVDGQLAVARVVMNRAASGKYPPSWCATVKQPWQFSFVRHGEFPPVDYAVGTRGARRRPSRASPRPMSCRAFRPTCLWYHADYVAPSWRQNLTEVARSASTSSTARKSSPEFRFERGAPGQGPGRLRSDSLRRGAESALA